MNLFGKKTGGDERRRGGLLSGGRRKGEVDNPYLAARRTWNDHVSGQVAARQMWQLMGLCSLLIALTAIGGNIYIGSQSKFIPYVVQVDKLGQQIAVGPVDRAAPVDPNLIASAIAGFVVNSRLVTPDVALQRKAVFATYAMLKTNDPATMKMNEWMNGREDANPFKRAEKEVVSIELSSIPLPQTPDTWQVDWVETVRDRAGAIKTPPFRMRALVTVFVEETTPDTTDDEMISNPGRVFVKDFSWSRQM